MARSLRFWLVLPLVALLTFAGTAPVSAGTAWIYLNTTSTGGTRDYTFNHPAQETAACPGWNSAFTVRYRLSYGAVTMSSIFVKTLQITTTVSAGHAASTDTTLYSERDGAYYIRDSTGFGMAPPTYTRGYSINRTIGFTQSYRLTLYHDSFHSDGESVAALCEVTDFIGYMPKKPPL
jgi:hypothetical protein